MTRAERYAIRAVTSPVALLVLLSGVVAFIVAGIALVLGIVARGLFTLVRHSPIGERIAYAWMHEEARADADRAAARTAELQREHLIRVTCGGD